MLQLQDVFLVRKGSFDLLDKTLLDKARRGLVHNTEHAAFALTVDKNIGQFIYTVNVRL